MNELVYRKENQVLTNSRLVAMKFNKRHSNVIRDIEELLSKLPENERKLNFELLEEDVEISNGGSNRIQTILSCCGACKDNLSKWNGDRTEQIVQVVKKERLSGDKRRIL